MKNSMLLIILLMLLGSCASVNRMTNEAIYHAIVGQNEMVVRSRLGIPAKTDQLPDSEKKLVYEFYGKGAPIHLNKSKLTFGYGGDMSHQEPHLNWKYSSANNKTNAPEHTIYEKDISFLEVFLNNEGRCVSFQHNMTKAQSEQLNESLKKYVPKGTLQQKKNQKLNYISTYRVP